MPESLKSKRVSWAPDYNLCKVRLFLSEDAPSVVGIALQDHLQAKASWILHPPGGSTDDALPPGFEAGHAAANRLHMKASDIPSIKWNRPPKLTLDLTWQVVAGEESSEIGLQCEREMRVLEAVYPRPSVIPPDPTFAADLEDSNVPNDPVLLVPITPVEDEDVSDTHDLTAPQNFGVNLEHRKWAQGAPPPLHAAGTIIPPLCERPPSQAPVETDAAVFAAANAALCAMAKSDEHRNSVDHELLLKLLSNSALIEKLVADPAAGANLQSMASTLAQFGPMASSSFAETQSHLNMKGSRTISRPTTSAPSGANGVCYPLGNGVGTFIPPSAVLPAGFQPPAASFTSGHQVKDVSYYKSLIQQHGGERQDTTQQLSNSRDWQFGSNHDHASSKQSKPKYMKPCAFFNSAGGCRNGANCAYQHDTTIKHRGGNIQEPLNAKRVKIDRD